MPADVKEPLNPLAIAKLLGPNTPTLDHFIRFFSTVRGTDKVLMVTKMMTFVDIHKHIPTNQGDPSIYSSLSHIGPRW